MTTIERLLKAWLHAIALAQVRARPGAHVAPPLHVSVREVATYFFDLLYRGAVAPIDTRERVHDSLASGRVDGVVGVAAAGEVWGHVKGDEGEAGLGRSPDSRKGLIKLGLVFPVVTGKQTRSGRYMRLFDNLKREGSVPGLEERFEIPRLGGEPNAQLMETFEPGR